MSHYNRRWVFFSYNFSGARRDRRGYRRDGFESCVIAFTVYCVVRMSWGNRSRLLKCVPGGGGGGGYSRNMVNGGARL